MYPLALRLMLLLAAGLLAGVGLAEAAVERFVDEQGTVHITNLGGPRAPAPEPAAPPPVVPGRGPSAPKSLTPGPPLPPPSEVPEAEPPQEPQSPAPEKGAGAPERPENAPPLASGKVVPAPRPAAAPADLPRVRPVSAGPAGERPQGLPVTTFRDAQGTLHITTAPAKLKDDLIRLAGFEWPTHLPRTPASAGEEGATLQVAESKPLPAALAKRAAVAAAAAPLTPPSPRTLRRFKDNKGVLHIVSRRTAPAQPVAEAPLPARPLALTAPYPARPPCSVAAPVLRDSRGARVAVRRDKKGGLRIVSEPAFASLARGPHPPPEALRPLTVEAARTYDLPVSLVEAVMRVESNFTPHAVSPKGAMGLMQLMPGTARDLGVEDPFCPRQNIHAGSRYLRMLLNLFGQDLPLALAAYNAGFRRVLEHGWRVPPIPETQDFVSRVLQEYTQREHQLARFRDGPG